MFDLATGRITWLHRVPAGAKLLVLAVAGAAVFLLDDLWILAIGMGLAAAVLLASGLPLRRILRQVWPAALLIAALAAFHIAMGEPETAGLVSARLGTVILLATVLTLTTRVSAMVDALEYGLTPLKWIGMNPTKVGFTLSLAIRFIPVLFALVAEIREAQKVRGLERSLFAVVVPLLVRTLKMADDLADAIAARGFDSD